jgi:tmRNA-binding protein
MKQINTIETECNAWMEERERTLKKLMYHAKPIDKIKYQAQIDFLSIVKINMLKILREVKQ